MPEPSHEPSWKRLFGAGGFAWSFRMRAGNAPGFFSPTADGAGILAAKRRALQNAPERYLVQGDGSPQLIRSLWDTALGWGLVGNPASRDLPSLALALEPDILLMDAGSMTLAAACVCFPSSWNPGRHLNRPVHEIHEEVPRLNPQVGAQIDRFLRGIAEGKAFLRENWSLTRTADHDYHPELDREKLDAATPLASIHLRLEHQMFTAIPGGVLMGIRIGTCPLLDLRPDPVVWGNLTEIIRTMPDDVAGYKSMLAARDAIAMAMAD